MPNQVPRRWALRCASAMLILAGCVGPDDPKIADVPKVELGPEAKKEPEGKPKGYGSDPRYEKAMEKMYGGGR